MNELCHTYEWVVSHLRMLLIMAAVLPIRAPRTWVMYLTHMNESCDTKIWVRHLTHMNESCHIKTWGMTRTRQTHNVNESCHTYAWAMTHESCTQRNESCHTYKWVMSNICMSHDKCTIDSHLCQSRPSRKNKGKKETHEWVTSHVWGTSHVWKRHTTCTREWHDKRLTSQYTHITVDSHYTR